MGKCLLSTLKVCSRECLVEEFIVWGDIVGIFPLDFLDIIYIVGLITKLKINIESYEYHENFVGGILLYR